MKEKIRIKKAKHAGRRGWFCYEESGMPINYLPFRGLDYIIKYFIPLNYPQAEITIEIEGKQ